MTKRSAETWAWVIEQVTAVKPAIIPSEMNARPPAGKTPQASVPTDFRVDRSGLSHEEISEVMRLLAKGHTKEDVAAALTSARKRRSPRNTTG